MPTKYLSTILELKWVETLKTSSRDIESVHKLSETRPFEKIGPVMAWSKEELLAWPTTTGNSERPVLANRSGLFRS